MSSTDPIASSNDDVVVRQSGVHGQGVFAARALPAGIEIGSYEGRRYTELQASRIDWDHQLTYLYSLSNGTMIDGAQGGNHTRFLNHSCAPNCQAVEHRARGGRITLTIETLRAIAAGEELYVDYGLIIDASEDPADYPCRCGAETCRGTMTGL